MKEKNNGLTGQNLKWIAAASMLIDHMACVFLPDGILYEVMRIAGRASFPVFCFLLVEGFFHTKDIKIYMLRLLAAALVSEVPFDLCLFGTCFFMGHQNVIFTMLIGLLVMYGIKKCGEHPMAWIFCTLGGMAAAYVAATDYSYMGILLIIAFFWCRSNPGSSYALPSAVMIYESIGRWGMAILAVIPIHFYNGKRGAGHAYSFYIFYPGHLLLLYMIREMVLRGTA